METTHKFILGDARNLSAIKDSSVHLVLTSPPYWNLKEYNRGENQLGLIEDYETFNNELLKVWQESYRILVPGGRLVVVVGDVLLSRKENGRHMMMPLHSDIQVLARGAGFDNLAPIIWHKISNANHEISGRGSFLGKPYEPNAIIKNDIEYILMLRKPGGYRSPTEEQRDKSRINKENFSKWFQQIWRDVPGASTKEHPAPFPEELASRLIQMFSFVEDTVVDPFSGYGTTALSAMKCGRNSVNIEIEEKYIELAQKRIMATGIASSLSKIDAPVVALFAVKKIAFGTKRKIDAVDKVEEQDKDKIRKTDK